MIEIRKVDEAHREDLRLPNQPFPLWGRMVPTYAERRWGYGVERFETVTEMCFPDEDYDYGELTKNGAVLAAYDGDRCVGLAVLQRGMFRYFYLYDLKIDRAYRGQGIAGRLLADAKALARELGLRGVYTVGQDNNLSACLCYLKNGFRIGGLDTEVYRGTSQEGKADIYFYCDC